MIIPASVSPAKHPKCFICSVLAQERTIDSTLLRDENENNSENYGLSLSQPPERRYCSTESEASHVVEMVFNVRATYMHMTTTPQLQGRALMFHSSLELMLTAVLLFAVTTIVRF